MYVPTCETGTAGTSYTVKLVAQASAKLRKYDSDTCKTASDPQCTQSGVNVGNYSVQFTSYNALVPVQV